MSMDTSNLIAVTELLAGPANFESWKREISSILRVEGLWGHVEGEENFLNPNHHLAIRREPPPVAINSTDEEIETYNSWALADAKAIMIIEFSIAPTPRFLLPQGTDKSAREIWKAIHDLFDGRSSALVQGMPENQHTSLPNKNLHKRSGRPDIISAFQLRDSLYSLKMKDHPDYMHYLSKFSQARVRLAALGLPCSELEMVYCIIKGLPKHGSWESFNMIVFHMMHAHIDKEAAAAIPSPPDTLFNLVTAAISTESLRLQNAEDSEPIPKKRHHRKAKQQKQPSPDIQQSANMEFCTLSLERWNFL